MVELSTIEEKDLDELTHFLINFLDLQSDPQFWRSRFYLWWENNPAFAKGSIRGWLLRDKTTIVGCLVDVPILVLLNGKELVAHSTSTWMVLPRYRGHGLSLLYRQIENAKGSAIINGTPTEVVATILQSLGFQNLPWGDKKEGILVINSARCAGALFGGFAAVLPITTALNLWNKWRINLSFDKAYSVAAIAQPGAEFDELWQNTRDLFSATHVRSKNALQWYCAPDNFVSKRLLACHKDGHLKAYMILKARQRRGLRTLDCVDFWSQKPWDGPLAALAKAAGEMAKADGFDLVSFPFFNQDVGYLIKKIGLFAVNVKHQAFVKTDVAPILPEHSYFVGLEGDAGTSPL